MSVAATIVDQLSSQLSSLSSSLAFLLQLKELPTHPTQAQIVALSQVAESAENPDQIVQAIVKRLWESPGDAQFGLLCLMDFMIGYLDVNVYRKRFVSILPDIVQFVATRGNNSISTRLLTAKWLAMVSPKPAVDSNVPSKWNGSFVQSSASPVATTIDIGVPEKRKYVSRGDGHGPAGHEPKKIMIVREDSQTAFLEKNTFLHGGIATTTTPLAHGTTMTTTARGTQPSHSTQSRAPAAKSWLPAPLPAATSTTPS